MSSMAIGLLIMGIVFGRRSIREIPQNGVDLTGAQIHQHKIRRRVPARIAFKAVGDEMSQLRQEVLRELFDGRPAMHPRAVNPIQVKMSAGNDYVKVEQVLTIPG